MIRSWLLKRTLVQLACSIQLALPLGTRWKAVEYQGSREWEASHRADFASSLFLPEVCNNPVIYQQQTTRGESLLLLWPQQQWDWCDLLYDFYCNCNCPQHYFFYSILSPAVSCVVRCKARAYSRATATCPTWRPLLTCLCTPWRYNLLRQLLKLFWVNSREPRSNRLSLPPGRNWQSTAQTQVKERLRQSFLKMFSASFARWQHFD